MSARAARGARRGDTARARAPAPFPSLHPISPGRQCHVGGDPLRTRMMPGRAPGGRGRRVVEGRRRCAASRVRREVGGPECECVRACRLSRPWLWSHRSASPSWPVDVGRMRGRVCAGRLALCPRSGDARMETAPRRFVASGGLSSSFTLWFGGVPVPSLPLPTRGVRTHRTTLYTSSPPAPARGASAS